MRLHRKWLTPKNSRGVGGALFFALLMCFIPLSEKTHAAASQVTETRETGVWQPPSGLQQIPIWPDVAPDMDGVVQPPESVLSKLTPEALDGDVSQAVFDVSSPTMTIFPPKGENTGAAIIVFPGGGYRAVVITLEGTEICNWIASKGITCVLSKYRVPGTNHHWDKACKCHITPDIPRALQDAQRTIRLVRSKAKALRIDRSAIAAKLCGAAVHTGKTPVFLMQRAVTTPYPPFCSFRLSTPNN